MTLPTSGERASGSRWPRSTGIGRAHAKVILLGEHAVVYGAPALALPVPQLTVTASAAWSDRAADDPGGISFTMSGSPSGPLVAQATASLRRLIAEFKASVGAADSPHLDVIIDDGIPHGRGLGSSAACARAVVLALADLFGRALPEIAVFDLVQTAENAMHGRSSGVDARAVGMSVPLLFEAGVAGEPTIGCDGLLVIADSGVIGRTKVAVERLRERFDRHAGARERFVRQASELTEEALVTLAEGSLVEFGSRLTRYHQLLRVAGLSTMEIDALVEAAIEAGSLGAKITGGGLGGCVIALARPGRETEVTRRMREAGAVRTWVVPLREQAGHAC